MRGAQQQQAAKKRERAHGLRPGTVGGGGEGADHRADPTGIPPAPQALRIRRPPRPIEICIVFTAMAAVALPRFLSPLPARARDAWLFAACLVGGGIAAALLRQDANWDLANYHLYNPWAWLTGRLGRDLAPAQLQSYYNPLLDVPVYAMVAAHWPPRAIAFVMGLPAGMAAFFLVKLAGLVFSRIAPPVGAAAVVAATAIGLTGANGRSMLGTTINEWQIAALLMAALWLVVAERVAGRDRPALIAAAGFLAGMACGLKLTAATYAVGIAAALLVRRRPGLGVRDSLVFGIAVLSGIALSLGPWMAHLYADTGSPLFPYFNGIFRSPLLPPESFVDARFGPRTAAQWISLPFALWHPPQAYVAESIYRDARFPMVAALALAALAASLLARRRRRSWNPALDDRSADAVRFIGVFFVVAFVIWAKLYSIYRYLLAAELVSGILIVALVMVVAPPRARLAALLAVAILVVASTKPANLGRVKHGKDFLDVALPPVAPGALVVLTDDAPMAHVLLRLPADARHVGLDNNIVRAGEASGIRQRAAAIVAGHPGPIYELASTNAAKERTLAAYGLARRDDTCAPVRSNIGWDPMRLCRVDRIGH